VPPAPLKHTGCHEHKGLSIRYICGLNPRAVPKPSIRLESFANLTCIWFWETVVRAEPRNARVGIPLFTNALAKRNIDGLTLRHIPRKGFRSHLFERDESPVRFLLSDNISAKRRESRCVERNLKAEGPRSTRSSPLTFCVSPI